MEILLLVQLQKSRSLSQLDQQLDFYTQDFGFVQLDFLHLDEQLDLVKDRTGQLWYLTAKHFPALLSNMPFVAACHPSHPS